MPRLVRRRDTCSHLVHVPCPVAAGDGLPRFVRSLGLDFIVTPEGRAVLIELQHGFGRLGLMQLFPGANRVLRQRARALLREHGVCFVLAGGLRAICRDKIVTYRHFADFQPPSCPYRGWSPRVERWLEGLEAEVILAKPPQESCGRGIKLFGRRAFLEARGAVAAPVPALLQAFTPCRRLVDAEGRERVGCIRHIVVIVSDGEKLGFVHMPSYWRVGPRPRVWSVDAPDREALTANISRGATPAPVDEADDVAVRRVTEEVCTHLVGEALARPARAGAGSVVVGGDGSIRGELLLAGSVEDALLGATAAQPGLAAAPHWPTPGRGRTLTAR
jgi:hypothetical protein